MFKELKFRGVITFSQRANQWIYYLQQLPLVGKHISNRWYGQTALKTAFGILGMIFGLLWNFVGKVMYFLFFMILPMALTSLVWYPGDMEVPAGVGGALIFYYFWICNLLYGSLFNGNLFTVKEEDFVMMSHFHVPAKDYLLSDMLWSAFLESALLVPVLWLPFGATAILLGLLRFAFRLMGEAANLAFYDGKKPDMTKLVKTRIAAMAAALAVAYGLPLLLGPSRIAALKDIFILPVWVGCLVLVGGTTLLAWRYLRNYPGYTYLAKRFYCYERLEEVDMSESSMLTAEIEIGDQDAALSEKERKRLSKLSGYEYLNALFFYRHKKLLSKSARRKQIALAAFGVGFTAATLFFPAEVKEGIWELLTTWASGVLVFVMYCLASGQRTCKAFFFHCDESLLKYGYYRQPGVLLKNFRIRLKYIMELEWQVASVISLLFLVLPFTLGKAEQWYFMLPVAAEALLLAAFFAMFHLFCYYVFQPYTADATVKNPVFSVLNSGIYIVSYVCLQLREITLWFPVGVLAVILVFLPVAFWAIYRFAPKTFRVRN